MTTTTHSYHESADVVRSTTLGAWTLVVGRFTDNTYCVDFYNSYNGQRTRHYHPDRRSAEAEVESPWVKAHR